MQHKNFFMVPNRIFDLELKPRDFTVYCCLLRHSDSKDGSCFPSRRVIAKECGMDRKTVDSAIENLSSLGLGYVLTVEGKQYPVLSCFSVSEETEEAKDKLKYLINGRKS